MGSTEEVVVAGVSEVDDEREVPGFRLKNISSHFIESFNFIKTTGLKLLVQRLPAYEFSLRGNERLSLKIENVTIGKPQLHSGARATESSSNRIFPSECRERRVSYSGPLTVTLRWKLTTGSSKTGESTLTPIRRQPIAHGATITKVMGSIPVMVKSNLCHLNGASETEMVALGEDRFEPGGFFCIKGYEKVIRQHILPRRNYPLAVIRNSWKSLGQFYTEFGALMRCVGPDNMGVSNVVHYQSNNSFVFCFFHGKQQFFIPAIALVKALTPDSDLQIFRRLCRSRSKDPNFKFHVKSMLRLAAQENLFDQGAAHAWIGANFRPAVREIAQWHPDVVFTDFILKYDILPHLPEPEDKLNALIFMIEKCYALATKECAAESPDSIMNHEILTPGILYQTVLKEKLWTWVIGMRAVIEKKLGINSAGESLTLSGTSERKRTNNIDESLIQFAMTAAPNPCAAMDFFLATGNATSKGGMGLMQASGFVIIAERISFMRYIGHYRSIHRGEFFAQLRTSSVRKLLPECWGFICPVHTPDGSPCGILNHMTADATVSSAYVDNGPVYVKLLEMGLVSVEEVVSSRDVDTKYYIVTLDGKVIGWLPDEGIEDKVKLLRVWKVYQAHNINKYTEIAFVPRTKESSQYPGLFIFTTIGRLMRPVINCNVRDNAVKNALKLGTIKYSPSDDCEEKDVKFGMNDEKALAKIYKKSTEYIGTFEQVYLDVGLDNIIKDITTHEEHSPLAMLSILGRFVPFSDHNQSPRNIYSCQMGKQTMGTPALAMTRRSDTKSYRLMTPASPLVMTSAYQDYTQDEYPAGINAVIAVISYTGYDMEDAMVFNRCSVDRGFGHASVYKSELVDLTEKQTSGETLVFGCPSDHEAVVKGFLDTDGLPHPGSILNQNDIVYSYVETGTGNVRVQRYTSTETGYLESVKCLGEPTAGSSIGAAAKPPTRILLTYRLERNPIIGDKVASRHGQKGICSQLWSSENLPWTESGLQPDILFNPHGYPSRMTVGMMIETMGAKAGALHGIRVRGDPFVFGEDDTAVEYCGRMLRAAGYDYYGTEPMYAGTVGCMMEVQIFVGVVFYQRLRHMVSDKFQVRRDGKIDPVTNQPVKGRKRGGGIKVGEMERDAIIAHGCSQILRDRLMICSDMIRLPICKGCGDLLSVIRQKPGECVSGVTVIRSGKYGQQISYCRLCGKSEGIKVLEIPAVVRYLAAELMTMGIRMKLDISKTARI